jgi:adenosylcobinamide-GDP ribazoletransferase
MSARRLILAIQFLTRLPTPQVKDFRQEDLSRSAVYYPLVGALIGVLLALPLYALGERPWLAGALTLLLWVWVTGALHLDGLGDVADAFGAAHRNPQRFLEVLKDPHMGVFGVVTLVMQLLLKFVLLTELAASPAWFGIVLVPVWARWGTLWWSQQQRQQQRPRTAPGQRRQQQRPQPHPALTQLPRKALTHALGMQRR